MGSSGVLAPAIELSDPAGRLIALKELLEEGGKPILLAFFKVSCPVCKLAWPYLARLHRAYGSAARVIGVSQNDEAASRRFYAENGGAAFELLLDLEPRFSASNAIGVESVPHLAFVEPDGTLERSFAGWDRQAMESLGAELARRAGVATVTLIEEAERVPAFKPG